MEEQPSAFAFYRVIGYRLFDRPSECVALTFFHADELRANNAIFVAVEKYERAPGSYDRFYVRVIPKRFIF
jgi:hypothetical protein